MRRLLLILCMLGMVLPQSSSVATAQEFVPFEIIIENVSPNYPYSKSGVFAVPVGATDPGPLLPGSSYEFTFTAGPGSYLSFATMFVPSNDLFFAPGEGGIALYDSLGIALFGDVTSDILLWDAGTEENEEPGVGPNQVQRQSGANTGPADANSLVRLVDDGFTYPAVGEVLSVSIDGSGAPEFVVTIENVSTDSTLRPSDGSMQPVPLSPGVWVVHSGYAPLFAEGEPDRGEGLEGLAEDGDAPTYGSWIETVTGLTVPLSPGVVAVHEAQVPAIFEEGFADRGEGLEALAEDGFPGQLAETLKINVGNGVNSSVAFEWPIGASAPGPIGPGGAYRLTILARPGNFFTFATMFVPSNDLFIAPGPDGLPLFDENTGLPLSGDATALLALWDAGTEENEEPGVGFNQVQRQPDPNFGPFDNNPEVRLVNDGFTYPPLESYIRVTVRPLELFPIKVLVQNISTPTTLEVTDGTTQPVPLSPGVWVVHRQPEPLFNPGLPDRGDGLEALAEDGFAGLLGENLAVQAGLASSGVFDTPVGSETPGAIGPGGGYEFTIWADFGSRLSLATMFVPSNDLFYSSGDGIPLFNDDGTPRFGEQNAYLQLWDAGTEENEAPGLGPNQVQRQSGPNTGPADADNTVRPVNDSFSYPTPDQVISVTLMPLVSSPFVARIENVSTDTTLKPSDGSMQAVPLSPGVWAVHASDRPLFQEITPDRGLGLEAVAEDGDPTALAEAVAAGFGIVQSGVFNTPVGADGPGPIGPGGAYEFTFTAFPGSRLSFASMFVPSNDLFFGPDERGIPLFNEDCTPVSGDVTMYVMLWDAGTEENEEPGVGPNQVQRQGSPNTGPADFQNWVRRVSDDFDYPDEAQVIKITLNAVTPTPFTARIENVSSDSTLLPSDGSAQFVPLSPGVWAVHQSGAPLFAPEFPDRGLGLEAIAEDGDPSGLASAISQDPTIIQSGIFNTPDGAAGPGPLLPGGSYTFSFEAAPGDHLSIATMFVPSNDLFYAPGPFGIPLFDEQGLPRSGDVTMYLLLWDAGTEENEEPGVGPNQVQRQGGANTGPADMDTRVRPVGDAFSYPEAASVIRVTLNSTPTSVDGPASTIPDVFALRQNYPNPFNPETTIEYDLAENGQVRLTVYDLLGRRVAELVNSAQPAGRHRIVWDGRNSQGLGVPSGIYLYRLESEGSSEVRRMLLLR